uniref:Probable E3 ubiquitin-protein ligase TRIML1 n=1 Tax=Labrus bergylta TaxID=56723 RepID=A0A3Q3GKS0_9LABR
MSATSCMFSKDQFLCSICLDVFTDPVSVPCGHNFCKSCITHHWDVNAPCQCPLCSKVFNSRPELHVNTFISEMAAPFRQSSVKKSSRMSLKKHTNSGEVLCDVCTETKVKALKHLKIQEMKDSVELSRADTDREKSDSVQVFTALIRSVEEGLAQLLDLLEEKQKTTEEKAEGFIKELEDEISELMERNTEVEQLLSTEDHLQSAVAQLEEKLSEEVEKQLESELMRIQQYAVDITLDPDTASPCLILSDDGKQVYYGERQNLPDNLERFSKTTCVLGKQSISAGKFYFEVEVKNKPRWELGVARGSINRKEPISPRLETGPWILMLRNGGEYKAVGVLLSLKSKPQKVGVFVDYEEGVVSFYDVDAAALIYSFTGCNFTEKLFPIFGPCNNDSGNNSAPLIITTVSQTQ